MKISTSLFIAFLALTALFAEMCLYSVPIFWKSLAQERHEYPGLTYLFKAAMMLTALAGFLAPLGAILERVTRRRRMAVHTMILGLCAAGFILLLTSPPPRPVPADGQQEPRRFALPHYDVDAYCKAVAGNGAAADDRYDACFETEQRSYDALKQNPPSLPAAAAARCGRAARTRQGLSYALLTSCLDRQRREDEDRPKKSFAY
jgi:hypothetical protein